jgi:hypothetical protein
MSVLDKQRSPPIQKIVECNLETNASVDRCQSIKKQEIRSRSLNSRGRDRLLKRTRVRGSITLQLILEETLVMNERLREDGVGFCFCADKDLRFCFHLICSIQ